MTGAIVSDILGTVGTYAWRLLCAISIVAVADSILSFTVHYYYLAKKSGTHGKMDTWKLGINLTAISIALMCITTIGALAIVLERSWVEQITAAFVVGQGFALRGHVECMLWGYILRFNLSEYKFKDRQIEVKWGTDDVKGTVDKLDLMHVYIKTEKGTHCIPWTLMQQYSVENR